LRQGQLDPPENIHGKFSQSFLLYIPHKLTKEQLEKWQNAVGQKGLKGGRNQQIIDKDGPKYHYLRGY